MWKEKDVVGFTVLNDKKARWSQVKIIYNARKSSYKVKFLNDDWEILSDADDSWYWEKRNLCGQTDRSRTAERVDTWT